MKILTLGAATSPHILSRAKTFIKMGCTNKILSYLPMLDYDVEIICPFQKLSLFSPLKRPVIFLKDVLRAIRVIRKDDYDICHVHYALGILSILAVIFSKKPVVIIVMGGDVLFEQHKHLLWYEKIICIFVLKKAEMVVCKSPYLKERVRYLGVSEKKIQICLFGVSDLFLKPPKFKIGSPYIFISSRPLKPFYNFEKLIDVIYELNQLGVNSYIRIFMLSPDKEYLEKLIMQVEYLNLSSKVQFLSSVSQPEDLLSHYQSAHFVIALPESDGIPQSALEGMAQGCVNILPENIVYKDVFNHENSILVSGNAKEIAKQIQVKISNLDNIRIYARQYVCDNASLEYNINKLFEKFYSLNWRPRYGLQFIMCCLMLIQFFDQFFFMGLRNKLKLK